MSKKEIINVYAANIRDKTGFFKTFFVMIKNMAHSKELIYQLFKRDFLMMHKKSFLGATWIIITPIIGILSWVFMNSAGVLNPGEVGIPYPAYVLLGSSIWGLFLGFYTMSAETLNSASSFILQVNFPHEALLIKQCLQQLINFLLSFILVIIVLFFYNVIPSWKILFFPFFILPLFLLASAIGLTFSFIFIVAPDIRKSFDYLIALGIYVTPVIYTSNLKTGVLAKIIKWNPLTYLVGGARDIIIYGQIAHLDRFLISSAGAFVLFLLALRFFYIAELKVIEKIG